MTKTLKMILAAATALVMLAPQAHGEEAQDVPEIVKETYMVGDSLTYHGADELQARRPPWTIDGERGRRIDMLNPLLDEYIQNVGYPKQLVIALGTNEGPDFFTKDVYETAVSKVPDSTRIVFVTMYRDPEVFGQERADFLQQASKWMKEIAETRPNTAIADWRRKINHYPQLLRDGVHANDRGERKWAELIDDAMTLLNQGP